jgi:hypothetical protein
MARHGIFNGDVWRPSLNLRDPTKTSPIDLAQFQAALDQFPPQKNTTTSDLIEEVQRFQKQQQSPQSL